MMVPAAAAPKCGPTPTQLVDLWAALADAGGDALAALPLAVNPTNLYFSVGHALMTVPIRGGPFVTLSTISADDQVQGPDLTLTWTSVILHVPTQLLVNGTIEREDILGVPLDGGAAVTVASSSGPIQALVADGQSIYFVDQGGIQSLPVSGGGTQLLAALGPLEVSGLAVVGPSLILTAITQAFAGGVLRMPSRGGLFTTLATNQPNASFPMACGPDVCWWTGTTPGLVTPNALDAGTSGAGTITRLDSAGDTTIASALAFPGSLVFDGDHFFATVACDGCDGQILRIPVDGGSPASMGLGDFVVVDDTCAYWSSLSPSAGIFSVAKSYVSP